MKKITESFLFIFSIICASNIFAQTPTRYLDPVFPTIDTTNNIPYATNFSILLGDTLPIPTGATIPTGVDADGNVTYFTMPALEFDLFEPSKKKSNIKRQYSA